MMSSLNEAAPSERHWCGGDAFETRFLEAMSLLAPEMERFLIAAVREGLRLQGAQGMAARGAAFLREEAEHSLGHHRFNRRLQAQGIDADDALAGVRSLSARTRRWLKPNAQLALSAACEHLSAIVSVAYLRSAGRARIRCPEVEQLFATHAKDEIAHRTLVFDLMRASGGGSWLARTLALAAVSVVAFVHAAVLVKTLMAADAGSGRRRLLHQSLAGLRSMSRWASWPSLFGHWLMYARPGFHPCMLPER